MHTTTKNTAAQANLETKRPKNDTYVSTAADPSKNVAPSHEIPDPDAMRGYPDAEERSENTLFIKSRGEKDELEDEDEDEGEEYDEDAEEARVEKILGFKPKPQIRPKGNRITDGRNVATEFGSVPQEEEEEDWRC
ncbi:MAG: hypothetical protein M1836_005089 [Candelina mexicana]|nr:MAG: hypothetical protein M1836_005089 [Candelina mexicana]